MDFIVNDALAREDTKTTCSTEPVEKLRIVIAGTGGGGNNTIRRLNQMGVCGAELMAFNTDNQDLRKLDASIERILIGGSITRGLGAGGFPEMGQQAAHASRHEISQALEGTNLLFLCAGMGGGTGTGSAPEIARIAKEQGALVLAIVTFPFNLERSRLSKARKGISNLCKYADTVVVIDNNKLIDYVPNLPIDKAFIVADEIVSRAVKGITETIMEPSLVNLDFADIKSVLGGGNLAMISVGDGTGSSAVQDAVHNTLTHPLLDVDYKGAKGALIHITGGADMTLGQANSVGEQLTKGFDPQANVMWGARICPELKDKIQVISIVSGVKSPNLVGGSIDYCGQDINVYTKEAEEWNIPTI